MGEYVLTTQECWSAWEKLLEDPRILVSTHEPLGLEQQWKRLSSQFELSPKVWMDSYLATYAIAGGMKLATFDRGFSAYSELDVQLV